MKLQEFLYRQKSRWKYHTAKSAIEKRISEINRYKPLVECRGESYYIREANLVIPKGVVDQAFIRFDLFIDNMKNLNGRYAFQEGRLFFLFDDFKIRIVSANELFIINEIFFHNCYNFSLPDNQAYNVIDIGMNVGLASLFFANRKDVMKIFSFEPFPQTFEQANTNFLNAPRLASKISAFNFGLGKGERMDIGLFNPHASGTSGVFLKDTSPRSDMPEQPILIKDAAQTLLSIIDENGDDPFVLKIDCEGAEYEILESLIDAGFPDKIIAILMEWHGSLLPVLRNKVLRLGFKVVNTKLGHNTGLIYAVR